MLPSLLAREITEGLKQFLVTGFESSTPYFSGVFQRFVERPGNFCKGPYLSVALPFRTAAGGNDFTQRMGIPFTPYVHQEAAWSRLRSDGGAASTIVATGTGSGKTECFLYPIIDHCRSSPAPGIKAVVIYPMNALANDQAKRFAAAIHALDAVRGKTRVGLFVGEGEHTPFKTMGPDQVITDKATLRADPPDILLTNYKMLDYLLVRPKDRRLWRFNQPETLRYLVVDELHTFDGAQGTDLACLLRRLRARLGTPVERVICVGTSATLGSGRERGALADYATRIFQSVFDASGVIGETRQDANAYLGDNLIEYSFYPAEGLTNRLDPYRFDSVADYIAAQYALMFPDQPPADPRDPQWRGALGALLKKHLLFHNLLRLLGENSRSLQDIVFGLSRTLPGGEARASTNRILDSLCALISWARDPQDVGRPLLQLRMQLWTRELRRMVMRVPSGATIAGEVPPVGAGDPEAMTPELTFADDHGSDKDALFLPLVQCSECRATAWAGYKPAAEGQLKSDLRAIYNAFFQRQPELRLLFPLLPDESPPAARGVVNGLCGACGHLQMDTDGSCRACGRETLQRVYLPELQKEKTRRGSRALISEHLCPVCGATDSMMVFGARTATLSSVAIHHAYATQYNDDKKLITFSDSVQDAAHRAGFFGARTWQNNIRMAMAQALDASGRQEIGLSEFYTWLPRYWSDAAVNPGAFDGRRFVAEFIAPNMLWYRDYEALVLDGSLPRGSGLFADVCKRLEWEVLAEFGYRSRIGRSLERTGTAALGILEEPVAASAARIAPVLIEELGLRDLERRDLDRFLWGLLLHLKEKGAIWHRFLDTYIEHGGRAYLLTRLTYLPPFAEHSTAPVFVTDAHRHSRFERLIRRQGRSWYQNWCLKVLCSGPLSPQGVEAPVYEEVMRTLTEEGVLKRFEARGAGVWGLNPDVLYLGRAVVPLATEGRRSQLAVPEKMVGVLEEMPSLVTNDPGTYARQRERDHWLETLYLHGEIHRVVAAEHTGLLEREAREALESRFITGSEPWQPNLLSATPTLEMGIDIGDLSSVLLCSVPPTQSNYLQRIGRAGRKDGNAFSMAVANARPHDLYFYADPLEMMAGRVEPPGVFLNASAVVARQLMAYCMDGWVASGIDESAIPATLRNVLDHVEQGDLKRFPFTFLDWVKENAPDLLDGFLGLFAGDFTERTQSTLRHALFGDSQDVESVEMRIVKRLHELVVERGRLRSRIDALKRQIDRMKRQPTDPSTEKVLEDAAGERQGLLAVLRAINGRDTFNFLTDEGLMPNYAFPEAGVTLRSVIYRRRPDPAEGESRYENQVYEYERPGAAAISEFAPYNRFYAGGRHVRIEQIDLGLSEIENWRFCPACTHAENLATRDVHDRCPRCGDVLWSDIGQRRQMVRLRQVMANTSDRDSRIGDESEDREPVFYTRQMLADFSLDDVEVAYRVANDALPFGFEFVRRSGFREINFGEYGIGPEPSVIAGREAQRPGFRLCRHCGMVQDGSRQGQKHAFTCKARNQDDEENLVECLYLYREFSSEAIRILMPGSSMGSDDRTLNSFIAAIQLGLKRKFGGQVDHLRLLSYDEPEREGSGRRHYLMLFDSVPGGTGYLQELMRSSRQLLEVFELARDTMVRCECNHTDSDGCYHCLYAYRNSYGMETTSRDTAVSLLNEILEAGDRFESVATISDIQSNPVLDSELEARFVEALRRFTSGDMDVQLQPQVVNGKPGYFLRVGECVYTIEPQVKVGPADGVQFPSKPDFMLRSARTGEDFKPVAVFLDGYEYHRDKLADDTAKRLAIVQSGRYLQWSLTWNDVNAQFAKSAIQSRNPFVEGLRPRMRGLQEELAGRLGIGDLAKVASQPPLTQLMRYLENPDSRAWTGLAFCRCLGWFDQGAMRGGTVRERFENWFASNGSEEFSQALAALPADRAYGGLAWDREDDPLSVRCVLPLEALGQGGAGPKPDFMGGSVSFDDSRDFEPDVHKAAWQGLLRAWNLLQFLPSFGFFSTRGCAAGVYEPVPWRYAWDVTKPKTAAPPGTVSAVLDAVLEEAVEAVHDGLRRLSESGYRLPSVAYELQDEGGEIVGEAELAWAREKIAGLLADQREFGPMFESSGWRILVLDSENQWVGVVSDLLGGQ